MMGSWAHLTVWLPWSAGVLFAALYLYVIGDIDIVGPPSWGLFVGEFSLGRILSARAPFRFEPVLMLEAGYVVFLLSPLNLFITLLMAGLLAANLHGAIVLHRDPQCRLSTGGSFSGALPALLAGGACCAPSLILLLGIPGLGAFTAFFAWLVPVSIIALSLSRVWQHYLGAPPLWRLGASRLLWKGLS